MSAHEYDAALRAPDNEKTIELLSKLAARDPVGSTLPLAAVKCLQAFCDSSSSLARRRWIGISLVKMIESSKDVVKRLAHLSRSLDQVGAIILNNTEDEETKIIAGLIIRVGLSQKISFDRFWPSDKVPNSAPTFPEEGDPKWMTEFQSFLDAMHDLHLADTTTDPAILYAVSLVASDNYKWRGSEEAFALVLFQEKLLTIITPGVENPHHIGFVDIPILHIESISCRRSILYDSQGRQTNVQPWDALVKLRSSSWTYRINSIKQYGKRFTILFENKTDANQCEKCIYDLLARSSDTRAVISNAIDLSQSFIAEANEDEPVSRYDRAREALVDLNDNQDEYGEPPSLPKTEARVARANSGSLSIPTSSAVKNTKSPPGSMGRGKEDFPTLTTGSKTTQRRPGALPIVKTSAILTKDTTNPPPTKDQSFDFPDESPRLKRPSLSKKNASPVKPSGVMTSKKASKGTTRPKLSNLQRKAKHIAREGHDTEDGEDPLGSAVPSQARRGSRESSSYKEDHNRSAGGDLGESSDVTTASKLPRVSRTTKKHKGKPPQGETDVFAIPKDDPGRQRTKRKSSKSIIYVESDYTSNESADSEYTGTKTRLPNKRIITRKAPKIITTHRDRDIATEPSVASTYTEMTQRHHLPSIPVQSSQPNLASTSKMQLGKVLGMAGNKENASPAAKEQVDKVSHLPTSAKFRAEIDIMKKLNDAERGEEVGVAGTLSQKRHRESSPPSTPNVKRAKKYDRPNASAEKPMISAPLRVLQDPSSPCGRRKRMPSNSPARQMESEMKPPAKPSTRLSVDIATSAKFPRKGIIAANRLDKRHTPLQKQMKQCHSSGSSNREILSSNSKPTPASPHAESRAISGHADRRHLSIEREIAEYEIEKSDPFKQRKSQKVTSFIRRLTGEEAPTAPPSDRPQGTSPDWPIEVDDSGSASDSDSGSGSDNDIVPTVRQPKQPNKPKELVKGNSAHSVQMHIQKQTKDVSGRVLGASKPVTTTKIRQGGITVEDSISKRRREAVEAQRLKSRVHADGMDLDGDTLMEQEQYPSPCHLKSSPPGLAYSVSSHSSTSADQEPHTDGALPTSEAREIEWEASLLPHQRALQQQLLRVSKRVMRHIVNNETTLEDIADTYASDGDHLLQNFRSVHNGEVEAVFRDAQKKSEKLRKRSEKLLKTLAQDRQQVVNDATSSR